MRGEEGLLPGVCVQYTLEWVLGVADCSGAYNVRFPSEALRRNIDAELASEDLKFEQEETVKQLRRLEKKQKAQEKTKAVVARPKENQQPPASCPKILRGKRSKLKRLKNKYKDQVLQL